MSKVYLKRNLRVTPSGTRKQSERRKGGALGKVKGSTNERESAHLRIDEYFKAQESTTSLKKDKDEKDVEERGVKVSSGEGESSAVVFEKGRGDNLEVIPQRNDDNTSSSHKPSEAEPSKRATNEVSIKPHTKVVHKGTKIVRDSGGKSKAAGRRKKKTATTGRSDGDSAPTSSGPRKKVVQQSIRDHFPVRRSTRKPKTILESEKFEELAEKLLTKDESGLKVVEVEGKGRGVISTRSFSRGELICEYSGELISREEAKSREESYSRDESIGCYMYYFEHKGKKLCVDATKDNGRMGRLLNHSKTQANVVTKLYEVKRQPYLSLVAARDINSGEELQYDYGERSKAAIESHPWLTA